MKYILHCEGAKDKSICQGCRRLGEGPRIPQWTIKPEITKGICHNYVIQGTEVKQ